MSTTDRILAVNNKAEKALTSNIIKIESKGGGTYVAEHVIPANSNLIRIDYIHDVTWDADTAVLTLTVSLNGQEYLLYDEVDLTGDSIESESEVFNGINIPGLFVTSSITVTATITATGEGTAGLGYLVLCTISPEISNNYEFTPV